MPDRIPGGESEVFRVISGAGPLRSPPRRAAGDGVVDGKVHGFGVGLSTHPAVDLGLDRFHAAADAGGEVAPETMVEAGDLH